MAGPIDLNTKLNFEKRVLSPSMYPVINNPDGSYSTHKMMWGDSDGKYYAYPSIVQLPNGTRKELHPDLAWQYAMENKEYRVFNTPEDAARYADGGYKQSWGMGENNVNGH